MIESWLDHHPEIDPTAMVHPSAVIIGEVVVGARSSVWPYVVMRGDMGLIRIGEDTNLQDGVICHDTGELSQTIIGDRVTVGHRAILHGCIVEDDCLIGMGSIVMDNARVGQGSVIGAGALVPVGRVIPPNSLVLGSPGRVVRTLSSEQQAELQKGWQIYRDTAALRMR
jgi:carbonic anhydrase/acetyltransferase-like protein (isoleucine patch superfamily)